MQLHNFLWLWLCGLLLISQGVAQSIPQDRSSLYRYRDPDSGFSISLPKDWQIFRSSKAALLAAAPKEKHTTYFRPNINVIVDRIEEEATLEELFRSNLSYAQSTLHRFRVLSVEKSMLAALPAMRMVYSCRLAVHNHVFDVKNCVYCLVFGERFYVLTSSTLSEDYDTWSPLFELINTSLRLF